MPTNRERFIDSLIDAGADDNEIAEALKLADQRGEFGGKQSVDPADYGVAGSLFPKTVQASEKGGGLGTRIIAGMADASTLPVRGLAGVAEFAGQLAGGRKFGEAAKEAGRAMSETRSKEEGVLGFVQNAAYDPTFVPGVASGATELKLMSKLPGLAKLAVPAVSGGLQAGFSSAAAQSEEGRIGVGETAKNIGIGAAVPVAAGAASIVGGKLLKETGKKLISSLIRPGRTGFKEGFNVENIMKDEELLTAAGKGIEELNETLEKRFSQLSGKVKEVQKQSADKVFVDVPAAYMRAAKKLRESNKFTGQQADLKKALSDLQENLLEENLDEFVDLATAMNLRTNYGTKVNYQPGIVGGGRKAAFAADAEEKVYDAFYRELSQEIKNKAPKEIAEIDKQYAEIIPILKAVKRRLPTETSNLPFGLMEAVGAGSGAITAGVAGEGDIGQRLKRAGAGLLVGTAISKGVKSPAAGRAMYGIGNLPPLPSAAISGRAVNSVITKEDEEKKRKRITTGAL